MQRIMTSLSWQNPLDEYTSDDLRNPGAEYCSTEYSIEIEITEEVHDESPMFAVGLFRDFKMKQTIPDGCSIEIIAKHVFSAEASKDCMLSVDQIHRNLMKFADDFLAPVPANPGYMIFVPVKSGEPIAKVQARINRAIYKRALATQLNDQLV